MSLTLIEVGNDKALYLHKKQVAAYCSQSDSADCHSMLEDVANNLRSLTGLPLSRAVRDAPSGDWCWDDIEIEVVYSSDNALIGLALEAVAIEQRYLSGLVSDEEWGIEHDKNARELFSYLGCVMVNHQLSIDEIILDALNNY